jgi:hypothetical protein
VLGDRSEQDPRVRRLPFGRLAGEYGVRQYDAVAQWARWALERLDAAESAGRVGSRAVAETG